MQFGSTSDSTVSQSSHADQTLSVAGWSVDPATLRIRKDGNTTKLEPLTMAVLMHLAANAGKTVTREEFEQEIWGDQVVVYQALSNTIAKLRKAFDDDPNQPRVIETIPKVGYRLIAEVRGSPTEAQFPDSETTPSGRLAAPGRWSRWAGVLVTVAVLVVSGLVWLAISKFLDEGKTAAPTVTASGERPSIAVLPFTNMSDDPSQEYFADGMTDDLITDLSKISGLFVLARTSTFGYKGKPAGISQIARELGADYVLEGSVRRSGDQVRINAQLIDAGSGGHVWAERYDSSMSEIFALQDKVTQSIVAALAVNLTADEKIRRERNETDNPEAYEAMLRGKARYELDSPEDLAKAATYLEKAIALDPDYARAHAYLAATYYQAWSDYDADAVGLTMGEADAKMREHLEEALKNPTPLAHGLASKLLTADLRFDEAAAEAERAVAMDPSDANGYTALARVLTKSNRPAEALEAMEMALRLNPRGNDNGVYLWRIGEAQYLMGRYEEAAASMAELAEFGDYWGNFLLGAALGQLGREEEARAAIEKFNARQLKKGRRPYTLAHLDGWGFVPAVREHYREGLRKAGLLPGTPSPVFLGVHKAPEAIDGATIIDVAEARRLFDAGVRFVDVRSTDGDWKSGHIPGAVQLHMYHDLSEARLAKVVAKDEPVVIYAYGLNARSSGAASFMAVGWGFTKVFYFRGGFPAWKSAGYPIEVVPE
jgi:TolB-like protein/DNA-binding winged helix-turn-helix (wHTH) protein/rhodanese-related sulfurtransferase